MASKKAQKVRRPIGGSSQESAERTVELVREKTSPVPQAAYFLELLVENIRCFGPKQRLNLRGPNGGHAPWTVILGNNGVGKTTLLQLLCGMLPTISTGGLHAPELASVERRVMFSRYSLIRNAQVSAGVVLTLAWQSGAANSKEEQLAWDVRWENNKISGWHCGLAAYLAAPSYGYGANRRQRPAGLGGDADSDTNATLFDDDAFLRNAEEWLLQTDYAASKPSPHQPRARKELARVKELLVRVLPGVSDIRVSAHESIGLAVRAAAEVKTADGWVSFSSLSLGYRTMTAWMVDFASRLFERYRDLDDPLTGPAVCLVDEIDLHLHPRWQRELIDHLSAVFPQTQFIVTAHSPLVVQAARDANLVVLRREGDHVVIDNHPRSVRNWRLDQILTSELFELPSPWPPELDALLRERDEILARPKLSAKDERRLRTLREQIGELRTGDTPEDIEAMELIREAARSLQRHPGK